MSEEEELYTDALLPGFIEARCATQSGEPCLVGTRVPFYVGLGWAWEALGDARMRRANHMTREQIIALAAFHAGYLWHRSRKRRKQMDDAVEAYWKRHPEADGEKGE